jgi:hypothetical protein
MVVAQSDVSMSVLISDGLLSSFSSGSGATVADARAAAKLRRCSEAGTWRVPLAEEPLRATGPATVSRGTRKLQPRMPLSPMEAKKTTPNFSSGVVEEKIDYLKGK